MLSIEEINQLKKDLEFERKANQQYSEMLIELNHKLEKIKEICLSGGDTKKILEVINAENIRL